MRYIITLLIAAALSASAGCVNVKVPEGPYVNLGEDSTTGTATADRKTIDRKAYEKMKDVLENARGDRVITSDQYKELMKRAEQKFDAR